MKAPVRNDVAWAELWRLRCEQLPAGLRHYPTVQSKAKPVLFEKIGCTCEVKP